ncbi:MAG: YdbH domain-containing protein [Verrucomicrobiota bacterium]
MNPTSPQAEKQPKNRKFLICSGSLVFLLVVGVAVIWFSRLWWAERFLDHQLRSFGFEEATYRLESLGFREAKLTDLRLGDEGWRVNADVLGVTYGPETLWAERRVNEIRVEGLRLAADLDRLNRESVPGREKATLSGNGEAAGLPERPRRLPLDSVLLKGGELRLSRGKEHKTLFLDGRVDTPEKAVSFHVASADGTLDIRSTGELDLAEARTRLPLVWKCDQLKSWLALLFPGALERDFGSRMSIKSLELERMSGNGDLEWSRDKGLGLSMRTELPEIKLGDQGSRFGHFEGVSTRVGLEEKQLTLALEGKARHFRWSSWEGLAEEVRLEYATDGDLSIEVEGAEAAMKGGTLMSRGKGRARVPSGADWQMAEIDGVLTDTRLVLGKEVLQSGTATLTGKPKEGLVFRSEEVRFPKKPRVRFGTTRVTLGGLEAKAPASIQTKSVLIVEHDTITPAEEIPGLLLFPVRIFVNEHENGWGGAMVLKFHGHDPAEPFSFLHEGILHQARGELSLNWLKKDGEAPFDLMGSSTLSDWRIRHLESEMTLTNLQGSVSFASDMSRFSAEGAGFSSGDGFSWRVAGTSTEKKERTFTYQVGSIRVPENTLLEAFAPAFSAVPWSGRVQLAGEYRREGDRVRAPWKLALNQGKVRRNDDFFSAENLRGTMTFSGWNPIATAKPQTLRFDQGELKGVFLENGELRFERGADGVVSVPHFQAAGFDGEVRVHDLTWNSKREDLVFDLALKQASIPLLLEHFPRFKGEMGGRLGGRIRLGLKEGSAILPRGYLQLDRNSQAFLKIRADDLLSEEEQAAFTDEGALRVVKEALRDLILKDLRVSAYKPDDPANQALKVRFEGISREEIRIPRTKDAKSRAPLNLNINVDDPSEIIENLLDFSLRSRI